MEGDVTRAPSIKDFRIIKPISKGAFGWVNIWSFSIHFVRKVFLSVKKNSDKLFAIKIVSKDEMRRKNLIDKGNSFFLSMDSSVVVSERDALAVSKCPYIVHLYYSLQSTSHVYLVRFFSERKRIYPPSQPILGYGVSNRRRFEDPTDGSRLPSRDACGHIYRGDLHCLGVFAQARHYSSGFETRQYSHHRFGTSKANRLWFVHPYVESTWVMWRHSFLCNWQLSILPQSNVIANIHFFV